MIVEKRLVTYLNSLSSPNTPFLNKIEKEALSQQVPIIRKETQSLLKLLLAAQRPQRILEVGTAVGFSTILMCEYGPKGVMVTTIEKYEKRFPLAEDNFAASGYADQITFCKGDATEILADLGGSFDFIFMDAAKGQYIHFLPHVLRLLTPGGMLVSDNVLQDGDVVQSRFAVTRRNRTIHSRMREYLYEITHTPELVTDILPVGDGVSVSVKE